MIQTLSFQLPGVCQKPISADMIYTETSNLLIIFCHGFKGFKDWGCHHLIAEYFAGNGINFLKFNFSHNGTTSETPAIISDLESFSRNTFSKELSDLEQVISCALSGEKFKIPEKLYLLGHSRGGALSIIQAAGDNRIDKLVTWAPLSNFRNLWPKEQEDKWRKEGLIHITNLRTGQRLPLGIDLLYDVETNAERLDIVNKASKVNQPWLIVHGEEDTTVPIAEGRKLSLQQSKSKFVSIPHTDHVFGAKHPWEKINLPDSLQKACDYTLAFLKQGE